MVMFPSSLQQLWDAAGLMVLWLLCCSWYMRNFVKVGHFRPLGNFSTCLLRTSVTLFSLVNEDSSNCWFRLCLSLPGNQKAQVVIPVTSFCFPLPGYVHWISPPWYQAGLCTYLVFDILF